MMLNLFIASLVWSFSFGLIKRYLTGFDPLTVAAVRLGLATLAFLPWMVRGLRVSGPARPVRRAVLRAAVLGAVQFGAMYVLYIAAYQYLPAYLVAVYTIFTPLYVVLLDDLAARRLHVRHLAAALLAVAGAAIVTTVAHLGDGAWRGILLLQGANLCFAAGQLGYRRLRAVTSLTGEPTLLAWMYLGAALPTALACLVWGGGVPAGGFGTPALLVLLYLGLIPTAVGFFLWNRGAVRTGAGRLAVANNLKIPLAILCAWLVFGEQADYLRVTGGLAVMTAALFLAGAGPGERPASPRPERPSR